MSEIEAKTVSKKHKKFIERLKIKNIRAYEELEFLSEYKSGKSRMLVRNKYGLLYAIPDSLFRGNMPRENKPVEPHSYFLKKLEDLNTIAFESLIFLEEHTGKNITRILARDKYGLVMASPSTLLSGHCPNIDAAVCKNDYFLEMLKEKNKFVYDNLEILSEYKMALEKIILKDEFGIVLMTPAELLQGAIPTILSAVSKLDYFIEKLKYYNPKTFDVILSIDEYVSGGKVVGTDKYGKFHMNPDRLLRGAVPYILSAVDKTEYWKAMAREIHGDKYTYENVVYTGIDCVLTITCKIHGDVDVRAYGHLTTKGCPKCNHFGGFTNKEEWANNMSISPNFDGFKVYLIRCWSGDSDESFYKVGITAREVSQRFKTNRDLPYEYEIIDTIELDNGILTWDIESSIHEANSNTRYFPRKLFGGASECFSKVEYFEEFKKEAIENGRLLKIKKK